MHIVDRTSVSKVKLSDEGNDYGYWIEQSTEARLDALESIREEFNNWKFDDQQRFQRVYRVIKQE